MRERLAAERLRSLGVDGALVAHVYLPMFFGIVFGWLRVSRTHQWDFIPALTYWILAVQICWLVQGGATWAVQRVLAPWRPRLLWLLLMGAAIGTPVVDVSMRQLIHAYHVWILPPELHEPVAPVSVATLLSGHLIGVFIWVVSNLAIVHVLGFARFGFARPAAAQLAPEEAMPAPENQPDFAARLTRPVGRLCVLKAEQHYLRVTGAHGDDLILYRISDAVRELEGHVRGLRVHRSYWVALHAVSHSERSARGLALRLKSGELVPVSRTCRDAVRQAGIPHGRPRIEISSGSPAFGAVDADVRAKPVADGCG